MMCFQGLVKPISHSKSGSVFVEAAMVFPLIIAVVAVAITCSLDLYTTLKENSTEHKGSIKTKYQEYEKRRLLVGLYSDDFVLADGTTINCNNCKS